MRGGSRRGLVSSSTSAPKKLRDFRQPAKGQVGETPLTIEKGIAGGGSWRAGPCPDGGASLFREAVADMDLVGEDRQGSRSWRRRGGLGISALRPNDCNGLPVRASFIVDPEPGVPETLIHPIAFPGPLPNFSTPIHVNAWLELKAKRNKVIVPK